MENYLNKAELCKKFNLCLDSVNKIIDYLQLPFEIKMATNYKNVPYFNQESIDKINDFLKDKTSNDIANFFREIAKLRKGWTIPMIAKECNCDRCSVVSIIKLLDLHYVKEKQNFYTKEEKDKIENEILGLNKEEFICHCKCLRINKKLMEFYNKGIELMRISDVANFFDFNAYTFSNIIKENKCKIYSIESRNYIDINEAILKINLSDYVITRNHSKGEDFVEKYLQKLGLNYFKEYRFDECKYKNKLPFDFYIPNLSLCIEVDGIQHIKGMFNNKENKDFKIRDDIKTNFCKNNNIRLIRIAWGYNGIHNYNHIEKYLDKEFDKIIE